MLALIPLFPFLGFLVTASALSGKGLIYYVASRALRIYPALLACIALTVLVLPLHSRDGRAHAPLLARSAGTLVTRSRA